MKKPQHSEYDSHETELCEQALIQTWGLLKDYREDLVLIGGLVPRYLCQNLPEEPDFGTMDVDLGLSLAVQGKAFNRIPDKLRQEGFYTKPEEMPHRMLPVASFYKKMEGFELRIDFLAERKNDEGIVTLDNMYVTTQLGVQRALEEYREVSITNTNARIGTIKVCEIGPFLCLKLRAHGSDSAERYGKDAFDLIHAAYHYDQGIEVAVKKFHAERKENPAFKDAFEILKKGFSFADQAGPKAYADFLTGGRSIGGSSDLQVKYDQLVQTATQVGQALLKG